MQRYFIEVAYKGTHYSGFQKQENANTIQQQVEIALQTLLHQSFELTCSSRTDAGVHALQNFYHTDSAIQLNAKHVYHLNAILPADIWVKNIYSVQPNSHCRFDPLSRTYHYFIYQKKDAFLSDRAWFFPFKVDVDLLNQAAAILQQTTNFTSFSKKHTQVNNFNCQIFQSQWIQVANHQLVYQVTANRFLRGMVKGLVGTMLLVGQQKISLQQFQDIINSNNCSNANFTPASQGLFLVQVNFPNNYFNILPLP